MGQAGASAARAAALVELATEKKVMVAAVAMEEVVVAAMEPEAAAMEVVAWVAAARVAVA